jgi:chromosome segregation protein
MYLSKIEILGFKSFAHRVELKYDSGVTAIVGPNGCGKTNIVDAIRWVLGEQRYGALRSEKMEDLIFNGTKNRKPLSMAEVSLTIENTKGILPTEYTEVTITRRVYRSGESEYLLNRVPCRLKDILDLFMDTGIGPDAYSVIELKMVETILSDKADERRRLFEEAAGVTKYKYRRKAAYRKLESVQQDLVRVNDIIKEIQKTVNSLERQAKRAEQYNEVSQRLQTIEVDLLEREYAYLHERFHEFNGKLQQAVTKRDAIDQELSSQDALLDELRLAMLKTEEELIEVQRELAQQVDTIHRVEERNLVASERRNSLNSAIERYEKEKVDLRNQVERLQNELQALNERRATLIAHLEIIQQDYRQEKSELENFSSDLSARKMELQKINDESIAFIHNIAEQRGEEEKLSARMENLRGRIGRSHEDNTRYARELEEKQERIRNMTEQDKELRRKFVEAEMHLYQEESRKKQMKEESDSLHHKAMALKMEIERKSARRDFLRGLIESAEGASEGTKFLLSQKSWKQKHLVTVADIVNADEKYRVAIEAALGDAASLIVVEQPEDAYLALDELRKHSKGKSTFIVLSRVPRVRRTRVLRGVTAAADLAQTKPQYRSLMNFLLSDVVVCENLDRAKQVAQRGTAIRCVTLDGQIVSSAGIVRGGSLRHDEGGFIGKQAQIAEFEQDVDRLKLELDALTSEQREKVGQYDAIDVKPLREEVKSIEKEMTALEISIAQL